ncbi:MAG: hypothetical protein IJ716_05970 [Lachnospiraceae bacterium]|nr:hypothetical protein [Lachnospiraceae bacterium]
MRYYDIMQLNGNVLLNSMRVVQDEYGNPEPKFALELAEGKAAFRAAVESVEAYPENAFWFQLRQCVERDGRQADTDGKRPGQDVHEDILRASVFYVNFKSAYLRESREEDGESRGRQSLSKAAWRKAARERKCRWLFRNGITITYTTGNGEEQSRTYLPFDKSAGMARESRILFIDQQLYDEMDQRLMLGYDFAGRVQLNLSKYYAYRGLYLSNGTRIDAEDFFPDRPFLNEESVLVLQDDVRHFVLHNAYTVDGDANEAKVADIDLENHTCFDGEGLISPAYAAVVNEVLFGADQSRRATSFQIRMPFTKGMLHEVDFHRFIREQLTGEHMGVDRLPDEAVRRLKVVDAFGRERSLEKVQIILTKSMFKAASWLKKLKDCGQIPEDADPMQDFWSRVNALQHALYVGNTDVNIRHGNKESVKLNYQFLDTLAMEGGEFEELVRRHLAASHDPAAELLALLSREEEEDVAEGESVPVERVPWIAALRKNPDFCHHPKVQEMLKGMERALVNDCCWGQIQVRGVQLFLCHDLLALLVYLMRQIRTKEDSAEQKAIGRLTDPGQNGGKRRKTLLGYGIQSGYFYTPNRIRKQLEADGDYGILRSPHLSRNEQCMLKAYIPQGDEWDEMPLQTRIYREYFGHLKGVLMLSYDSVAALTLGGADYDGDLVKLVTEPVINAAIRRSVYREGSRSLPVVSIPGAAGMDKRVPKYVDYETVRNSFSGKVGQISNLAHKSARVYYFDDMSNVPRNVKPEDIPECPMCTILTGMEIDAAKTGKHPELPAVMQKKWDDYYLKWKDAMRRIGRSPSWFIDSLEVELIPADASNGHDRYVLREKTKKEKADGKNRKDGGSFIMEAEVIAPEEQRANIDRLPYLYLKELYEMRKCTAKQAAGNRNARECDQQVRYFAFERDPRWKKQLKPDIKRQMEQLEKALQTVDQHSADWYKHVAHNRENKNMGYLYTTLQKQYGDVHSAFRGGGETVEDALLNAVDEMYSYFQSEEEVNAALNKVNCEQKSEAWKFAGYGLSGEERYEARKAVLQKILGGVEPVEPSEELARLVCNFDQKGYYLLQNLLMQVKYMMKEEASPKPAKIPQDLDQCGRAYLEEFDGIFRQAVEKRESKRCWMRKVYRRCHAYAVELTNGQTDEALQYAYALDAKGKGKFFWDVFTAEEILDQVIPGAEPQEEIGYVE